MITPSQVIGKWDASPDLTTERRVNIDNLCDTVNKLLYQYEQETGNVVPKNRVTGTQVSGEVYGGFRPQDCPIGTPNSAHKQGMAVDIYDPDGGLDQWITDAVLIIHDLYREHPDATVHWCHLTTRSPASGNRTFRP